MLTATIDNAKTLKEFYTQIRTQQEDPKNHGPKYCAHHDLIQTHIKDCDSFKELGTHQGASAAAALLAGVKEVHLVDHTLEKYNWQKHLFEEFAKQNNVNLNAYECSSIDKQCAIPTDMLHIDSLHEWRWTIQELTLHAPITKKYIVLHDTSIVNGRPSDIWPGLVLWCKENPEWRIKERVTENVGATIVERV
jgi:hypothetical protein